MPHERDMIAALKADLAALPPPTRTKLSTREAVTEMADVIEQLRARRYNLREVAELLTKRGLHVAENTLRAYLRQQRRKPRQKNRLGERAIEGEQSGAPKVPAPASAVNTAAATVGGEPSKTPTAVFPYRPDDNDL